MLSWLGPESISESESEECESNVKLENETNPDVVNMSNFPSKSPSTRWLVGCRCHRYDFLVRVYGMDLTFSNFLNFLFSWD